MLILYSLFKPHAARDSTKDPNRVLLDFNYDVPLGHNTRKPQIGAFLRLSKVITSL